MNTASIILSIDVLDYPSASILLALVLIAMLLLILICCSGQEYHMAHGFKYNMENEKCMIRCGLSLAHKHRNPALPPWLWPSTSTPPNLLASPPPRRRPSPPTQSSPTQPTSDYGPTPRLYNVAHTARGLHIPNCKQRRCVVRCGVVWCGEVGVVVVVVVLCCVVW